MDICFLFNCYSNRRVVAKEGHAKDLQNLINDCFYNVIRIDVLLKTNSLVLLVCILSA